MPDLDGSPTLGEVVRRLEEAIREIRETRRELSDSQARSEATFLRKSEFLVTRQTDDVVIRGLDNSVHSATRRLDSLGAEVKDGFKEITSELQRIEDRHRTDRMWLIGGLAFPLIIMLIGAVILGSGPS